MSVDRADIRPGIGSLQGVGHHQIGMRMPARAFGDLQQLFIADADFQLELDEESAKSPLSANAVDQLGCSHESQPQFRLITLDLAGGSIDERGELAVAMPLPRRGVTASLRGRRVNA